MPRTVSANLKTHLASNVTTVNFLWKITSVDTTEYHYTDCDQDIIYDGDTYSSLNSGDLSAIEQQAQLNPDNFDFTFILDDSDVAKNDLVGGKFDYADVRIYMINRESTGDGVINLMRGKLGQITITEDNQATIEFRSLTQLLSQGIGRNYSHECDADLGDSRCNLSGGLGPITDTGTLTGVTDNQIFSDSSRTEADDHYNYGLLTWTTGNNDGLSMEVKDFVNSTKTFTLVSPMPFTVQVGDMYSVYQGCDKTKTTCINDFDNVLNFRGFAEIPGNDQINKTPDINPDAGLHD